MINYLIFDSQLVRYLNVFRHHLVLILRCAGPFLNFYVLWLSIERVLFISPLKLLCDDLVSIHVGTTNWTDDSNSGLETELYHLRIALSMKHVRLMASENLHSLSRLKVLGAN